MTREEILNKLVELLGNIKTANGYNTDVKIVLRRNILPDELDAFELPSISVVDGVERRTYEGRRGIGTFNIFLRCWVRDEENTSTPMNALLSDIEKLVYENSTLDGLLPSRVKIIEVSTDEGWLFPYGYLEVILEVTIYYDFVC